MIPTSIFVEEMKKHWEQGLGNVSNEALEATWGQMADAFIDHVRNHKDPNGEGVWTVLGPPTGTGKTQGTILYCAMLSKVLKVGLEHPGALIVTKLIEDSNIIAAEINRLSRRYHPEMTEGTAIAVAYHSKNKQEHRREELKSFPVLVITHKAFEMALANLDLDALDTGSSVPTTWACFHVFKEGERKLVIVDEAIDLVVESRLDGSDMRRLYGLIPGEVRREFPMEMLFLDELKLFLEEDAPKISRGNPTPDEMLHGGEATLDLVMALVDEMEKSEEVEKLVKKAVGPLAPLDTSLFKVAISRPFPDFRRLREALRKVRLDQELWMEDAEVNRGLYRKLDSILSDADALYRQWHWYAKTENRDTLNTARLLVPENIKGAVVLDATATENVFYEIFDKAKRIPPILGTRRYDNVTLRVSTGHSVGKVSMRENAEELCAQLVSELEERFKERKVLIITHLDVEPELVKQAIRLTEAKGYSLKTAHWGAVNGSNAWRDCDSVVVFGLPYRPDTLPVNTFMACRGPMETEWMTAKGNRPFNGHQDIKEALIVGQLVTDVIQGINRIRCRNVIDAQGNCPQSDIYILLPHGSRGDAILQGIQTAMPGLQVRKWAYDGKKRLPQKAKYEDDLVGFLRGTEEKKILAAVVRERVGIPNATFDRLIAKIRKNDPEDSLVRSLAEAGFFYVVIPEGRTRKAYFSRGV